MKTVRFPFDSRNILPKPKYILKYRQGREFNYLAFWNGCYDEVTREEVRRWKRQGVPVKDGDK